jgi:acyl-CoA thioesterase I
MRLLLLIAVMWIGALSGGARAETVLVLGDSLSAGYGLNESQGWVAQLQTKVNGRTPPVKIVNASISGETTAGGLTRLPELLKRHQPTIVIVQLGANDGLRGLPIAQVRGNLEKMISLSRAANARVLLLGIELPINYGRRYRDGFRSMYAELAKITQAFEPFFLSDIASDRKNFQADGIHPNAQAQSKLLARVWAKLEAML